jgi:peptidoglycan/LPS O-acetylase OafA/YrhL
MIFQNFEAEKLIINNPNTINWLLFLMILILVFISLRKRKIELMDTTETEQLKGLAILFVIFGHFWIHTTQNFPGIILSGEAVSLFFILSGYGLMKSYGRNQKQKPGFFFLKRIKRVMIPYWLSTILFLILDYIILNRLYGISDIVLTFLGVNITKEIKHIDYVRWFISLLLFWYISFAFVTSFFKKKILMVLFLISLFIYPIHYYLFKFGWYQILSFPFGCLLAFYGDSMFKFVVTKTRLFLFSTISLSCLFLFYKISFYLIIKDNFPYLFYSIIDEMSGILFSFFCIVLINIAGRHEYYSKFLVFIGGISYELFLLHGAFLIKYNPIISNTTSLLIILQLIFFFFAVSLLSVFFQKTVNIITRAV